MRNRASKTILARCSSCTQMTTGSLSQITRATSIALLARCQAALSTTWQSSPSLGRIHVDMNWELVLTQFTQVGASLILQLGFKHMRADLAPLRLQRKT